METFLFTYIVLFLDYMTNMELWKTETSLKCKSRNFCWTKTDVITLVKLELMLVLFIQYSEVFLSYIVSEGIHNLLNQPIFPRQGLQSAPLYRYEGM
jgi:hypothetical protein